MAPKRQLGVYVPPPQRDCREDELGEVEGINPLALLFSLKRRVEKLEKDAAILTAEPAPAVPEPMVGKPAGEEPMPDKPEADKPQPLHEEPMPHKPEPEPVHEEPMPDNKPGPAGEGDRSTPTSKPPETQAPRASKLSLETVKAYLAKFAENHPAPAKKMKFGESNVKKEKADEVWRDDRREQWREYWRGTNCHDDDDWGWRWRPDPESKWWAKPVDGDEEEYEYCLADDV